MKHENLNCSSQFRAELIITQNTKLGKIMLNAKFGNCATSEIVITIF